MAPFLPSQFIHTVLAVSEQVLVPLAAAAAGHRARMEEHGFTPEDAASAAIIVHNAMALAAFNLAGGSPCPTCPVPTTPPTPE